MNRTRTKVPGAAPTTQSVVSADGTLISFLTFGAGPAVIVVPGALALAATYTAFASALGEHFAMHVMERRGRGLSGPQGADYSVVTECADVRAVQRATGASFLVGHSFGGLVALEAARANAGLARIAVYEPGVSIGGSIPMDWMPDYERHLSDQRYLDAFVAFSRGTGPDRARTTPPWLMKPLIQLFLKPKERERMLGLLSENLREHQALAQLDSTYAHYREIDAGVLLMAGGKSHLGWVDLATERLASVIPHSETRVFPRLNHFGIDKTGPQEVARAVSEFFLAAIPKGT